MLFKKTTVIILFILLFGSVYANTGKRRLSEEHFLRLINNEQLFLWNLYPKYNDENGFKSVKLLTDFFFNTITPTINKNQDLSFQLEGEQYLLIEDKPCLLLNNKVYGYVHNLFKDKVYCIKGSRNSQVYLLIIGDNNNEIVKEIKENKENKQYLHPIWYDYK